VRQALFNVLERGSPRFEFEGARVLDLFAGSGALGLEALSRGARCAVFIEDDAAARGAMRRNVEALGLTGVTKIWRRDARDLGPMAAGAGGPFQLAFLDAPYRKDLTAPALASLLAGAWLTPGALVIAETAEDETLDAPGFVALDRRVYGETAVHILSVSSG
jgi:16S rRNA (guanine966-N2)-methyltransferase